MALRLCDLVVFHVYRAGAWHKTIGRIMAVIPDRWSPYVVVVGNAIYRPRICQLRKATEREVEEYQNQGVKS